MRTKSLLSVAAIVMSGLLAFEAFGFQESTKTNPSGQSEMKTGAKEMGKAGKSLGGNVKRGRVVRGGKNFGKHVGRGGKRIGRGTKKIVKKAIKP